jgi:hypothetical protein
MTKQSRKSIKPSYWVAGRDRIVKSKREANRLRKLGIHVYPVYAGNGAASEAPMATLPMATPCP